MSENHNTVFRPLVGGIAIRNVVVGQKGTLGLIATSNDNDRWLVSCYHVLCRNGGTMPSNVAESIAQPRVNGPDSIVARITDQRALRTLDCAAAEIIDPTNALGQIYGVGRIVPPIFPRRGMRVVKSGAETGVTEGIISKVVGEDVEIEAKNPTHVLCDAGDSGSVWIDAETMAPVALNCQHGNPGNKALGKSMLIVLVELGLRVVIG